MMKRKKSETKKTLIAIGAVIIAIVIIFGVLSIALNRPKTAIGIARANFGEGCSIGKTGSLQDITVSPYKFEYVPVVKNNETVGYIVFLNFKSNKRGLMDYLFGTPDKMELAVIFKKDGEFSKIIPFKPGKIFDDELIKTLSEINKHNTEYIIKHVGFVYKTKDKNLQILQNKISNACMLLFSKVNGKEALYKIIPPPGKNRDLTLKSFISSLKLKDYRGNNIDFSVFKDYKFVVVTVNPYCGSCVDNFKLFISKLPVSLPYDKVVVITEGDADTIEKLCAGYSPLLKSKCILINDKSKSLIGQGKLPLGNLVMFEKNFKLFFDGPIADLLNDPQVFNKVVLWQRYENRKLPTP